MRFILTLSLGVVLCASLTVGYALDASSVDVKLTPLCGPEGFRTTGPIPIVIHIYNRGADKLPLLLGYPLNNCVEYHISGVSSAAHVSAVSASNVVGIGPGPMLLVEGNSESTITSYLNENFDIENEGVATISWTVYLQTISDNKIMTATYSGIFSIPIRVGDAHELESVLSRYLSFAQTAKDDMVKSGYVEGICSIHQPVVIPFLQKLLTIPQGKKRALDVLCDEWLGNRDADEVIGKYLDSETDSNYLLSVISRNLAHGRMLSNKQLSRLVDSDNPAMRSCGIWYIQSVLSSLQLERVLKGNDAWKKSENENLFKTLSDILERIGRVVPQKEAGKSTANGF